MDNNNAVFNEAPTMMPSTTTSPTMSLTMYPTSYSSVGIMTTFTESPSSSPTESQSFRSRYWVLGMQLELFFGFVFLLMLLRTWIDKKRGEGSGGGGNGTNSGESSENEGIATQIKKLTTEDWIQLYNKTFDSNGNTTTLTSENIVGHSKDFVDIELGGQGNAADGDGDGEKKYTGGADGNDDSSSLYLSLDTNNLTSSRKSLVRLSPAEDTKISGTCIICFDEFVAGDEVVWAEGRKAPKHDGDDAEQNRNHHDCKHVFHKDCMVRYLASNSHRRFKKSAAFEGAEGIENPCPTCRQPFCTLSDEDLEMAIQTKLSLLMAEETENNAGGATLPVEQRA